MSPLLGRLVREAREDWGTREVKRVDWAAIDRKLFRCVEEERRRERRALASGRWRGWSAMAMGLAAAAAVVAISVDKAREPPSFDAARPVVTDRAGTIVALGGDVFVDGKLAATGRDLRLGDVIETRGGPVTIDRPGKLSIILERASRATVTHARGGLVVALERGALEARVAPVASGEAFAVDVGPSRVAVHGTHLRVAYAGGRVVVDLTEGVVLIGKAPRVGSERGTVVTAPAHVEFEASGSPSILDLSHEPGAVRAPNALLGAAEQKSDYPTSPVVDASTTGRGDPRLPTTPTPVRADAGMLTAPTASTAPPSAGEPDAQTALVSAVRGCMAERPHADNVTILMSTTLRLELNDDGTVRSARFDPPVAADVNTCAATAIYKARFTYGGSVAIPIDFIQ